MPDDEVDDYKSASDFTFEDRWHFVVWKNLLVRKWAGFFLRNSRSSFWYRRYDLERLLSRRIDCDSKIGIVHRWFRLLTREYPVMEYFSVSVPDDGSRFFWGWLGFLSFTQRNYVESIGSVPRSTVVNPLWWDLFFQAVDTTHRVQPPSFTYSRGTATPFPGRLHRIIPDLAIPSQAAFPTWRLPPVLIPPALPHHWQKICRTSYSQGWCNTGFKHIKNDFGAGFLARFPVFGRAFIVVYLLGLGRLVGLNLAPWFLTVVLFPAFLRWNCWRSQ